MRLVASTSHAVLSSCWLYIATSIPLIPIPTGRFSWFICCMVNLQNCFSGEARLQMSQKKWPVGITDWTEYTVATTLHIHCVLVRKQCLSGWLRSTSLMEFHLHPWLDHAPFTPPEEPVPRYIFVSLTDQTRVWLARLGILLFTFLPWMMEYTYITSWS